MVNSKVAEFENLLRNPYASPSTSAPNAQSPFSGATPSASSNAQSPFPGATPNASFSGQSNFPPSASSFSQLGAILNTGLVLVHKNLHKCMYTSFWLL